MSTISNIGSLTGISTLAFATGGCFIAGTFISTPDGDEQIENMTLSQQVTSYGESQEPSHVKNVIRIRTDGYFVLSTEKRTVSATGEHPFFTADGLKVVDELQEGDVLYTLDGEEVLISKVFEAQDTEVFNLQVTEPNTYYANGFAVHNKP